MRLTALLLVIPAVAGCRQATDRSLLPLDTGREWTYIVQAGFQTFVEKTRVVGDAPVEGAVGRELEGPLGRVRLGWSGDRLLMAASADSTIRPPLPIAVPVSKVPVIWHGRVDVRERTLPSSAKIVSEQVRVAFAGRPLDCRLTTVRMRMGETDVELRTWYHPGTGIIQQEQRTDRSLDFQTKLLTPPDPDAP